MKKTNAELNAIKSSVELTYANWGNTLMVNLDKVFDPNNPELGYCFKYKSKNSIIYNVVCSRLGISDTDFRIMMHEYGHIYLGHLDGIHEELDSQICKVFQEKRGLLIDYINESCGIDFADVLIQRVIDDPMLNHSLHNIAMDMEVNSKILSDEDIEEMEKDISSKIPDHSKELLEYIKTKAPNDEVKKSCQDAIDKMNNSSKIKLILPSRYHFSDGTPFPDNLTYPEYLMLIIENLDQFIKMMVSIKNGNNGDTSDISNQDVQNALNNMGQQGQGQQGQGQQGQGQQGQGQGQGQQGQNQQGQGQNQSSNGGGGGIQSLEELMEQMGMTEGSSSGKEKGKEQLPADCPYKGKRDSGEGNGSGNGDKSSNENQDGSGLRKDHGSDSRDEADEKRKLGQISYKGGTGCGSGGSSFATRETNRDVDEVDMALDEVILNLKNRVIKKKSKRDLLYTYNHGINRKVILPLILRKTTISTDPKIVFLIDISGSMDTTLVDRILKTISKQMKHINKGLRYDIITWSTRLGEHIKDIDPRKPVPRISMGGGTRMAKGIEYFRDNYTSEATLILISDFEDYLEEWHEVELKMPEYQMYGFNYGSSRYNQEFKYFKVKNFKGYGY